MPDAKCVARKVRIPAHRIPTCVTVGCCHLSAALRQCVLVVGHSDYGCILSSECQDLQSAALTSQKHLNLTPVNHSYVASIAELLSPEYLRYLNESHLQILLGTFV